MLAQLTMALLMGITSPVISVEAKRSNILTWLSELFGGSSSRDREERSNDRPRPQTGSKDKGVDVGQIKVEPKTSSPQIEIFNEECKIVNNGRSEPQRLMVPSATREEWLSIQQHPPANVTFSSCHCGRGLSFGEIPGLILKVSGRDPQAEATPKFPLPGYWPPYSSNAATVNQICAELKCGAGRLTSSTSFSNPSDDAILRWNGTAWEKFPARQSNSKLNHRSASTIFCALP